MHLLDGEGAVVFRSTVCYVHSGVLFRQKTGGVFAPFDQYDAASVQVFVKADLKQGVAVQNAV